MVCAAALLVFGAGASDARAEVSKPSAAQDDFGRITAKLERRDGLLPVYLDKAQGRIYLALPPADAQGFSGKFLYMTSLQTGLGSAPVGLDRDKPGGAQVLVFRRIGRKVLAEYENTRFRATGAPADEQAAARDSFAYSTIWSGEVAADAPGGGTLVEISGLLDRDVLQIADSLKQAGEGTYRPAPSLTVVDTAAVKVFPENIELESRQTFEGDGEGPEVGNIAPDPKALTFVVRHSLVKLPEPGFKPRLFDSRTADFDVQVLNFAAPLTDPIVERLAVRFRLEKLDPTAARSRVKKPIVFYVDRAAPEPIRSALVEGASWWRKAFEAAGYIDAYRVEVLPEGADPLDARYNVIHWVDRATRGWSYGEGIVDPRTGEIVKGSVLLGALRVRQDMLIFEGLVGTDQENTGGPNDPVRVALTRMRQLAAHEVGHALGFQHNFAGSTIDRASVMDYPPPRIGLKDGRIDLSDAYGVGVGKWDLFTVDWLYADIPDGPAGQAVQLAKTKAAFDAGLRFVADPEARPMDSAHPWGSLWDDGADPAAELNRMMKVRRVALDQFGLKALAPAEPVADLRRKLVPIYLLHRYQVEATAKLVGGVIFPYGVAGDGAETSTPVPAERQRAALDALAATLAPAELAVPSKLLPLLSTAQSASPDRQFDIEVFRTAGGQVFDPLAAADVAAGMTCAVLLAPARLNRATAQHGADPASPGAGAIADRLIAVAFGDAHSGEAGVAEVRRRLKAEVVRSLAVAARDPTLDPSAGAAIEARLRALALRLQAAPSGVHPGRHGAKAGPVEGDDRDLDQQLARQILDRREMDEWLKPAGRKPVIPPGMPIGEDDWFATPPPATTLHP
jgi:hypothetical protein